MESAQARLRQAPQLTQGALEPGCQERIGLSVLMTHRDVNYASVVPELMAKIPQPSKVEVVICDGAYDTKAARAAIAGCGALVVIPREGLRALVCQPGRGASVQRGHRAHCPKRQAGL
jgi:hypothetical protein